MHHEREDGSGYPMGLKGHEIHEFAKIIAIADIYDAMISKRVYKSRKTPFDFFELLENDAFGYLDTTIVNTFINNVITYYIGNKVILTTDDVGEIIHINPRHISKPIVKVGSNYVDLTVERNIKVKEII